LSLRAKTSTFGWLDQAGALTFVRTEGMAVHALTGGLDARNRLHISMLFDCAVTTTGPHVCPRCGERVSAFAAGCALCGADLDPRRAQKPPSVGERVRRRLVTLPVLRRKRSLVRR
jgi:hypothetical protein